MTVCVHVYESACPRVHVCVYDCVGENAFVCVCVYLHVLLYSLSSCNESQWLAKAHMQKEPAS